MKIKIEIIKEKEYLETSKMIERALKNSLFSVFYPEQSVLYVAKSMSENGVKERASWTHFYVAKIDEEIVGCGAIGPYYDSETESSLFSIFVDSAYQGQGIGRRIVETLENDEYFKRAKRIEVPAAMSAIPFYKKLGYNHKNGELIYDDGHFCLEKFNKTSKKLIN